MFFTNFELSIPSLSDAESESTSLQCAGEGHLSHRIIGWEFFKSISKNWGYEVMKDSTNLNGRSRSRDSAVVALRNFEWNDESDHVTWSRRAIFLQNQPECRCRCCCSSVACFAKTSTTFVCLPWCMPVMHDVCMSALKTCFCLVTNLRGRFNENFETHVR